MDNITFYSYPKPWLPEYSNIQACAVSSWKKSVANPQKQIVLLGDDQGTADASKTLEVSHRGSIEKNMWGTPLISSIMDVIRVECPTELVCFINTDIVLGEDDFKRTIIAAQIEALKYNPNEWLLIGQRTDVPDINKQDDWKLHGVDGIDYFVFPRDTFQFVYPFALGKFSWDQWLVGNAFRRGLLCIDATSSVLALHLNAKWFFQGQPNGNWNTIFNSEEARINRDFDYYQRNIANGTTHYTKNINGKVYIVAKPIIG